MKDWRDAEEIFGELYYSQPLDYAIAYLIEKYDMGIGLFKQEGNGHEFTSLHMKTDDNGIYQPAACK